MLSIHDLCERNCAASKFSSMFLPLQSNQMVSPVMNSLTKSCTMHHLNNSRLPTEIFWIYLLEDYLVHSYRMQRSSENDCLLFVIMKVRFTCSLLFKLHIYCLSGEQYRMGRRRMQG